MDANRSNPMQSPILARSRPAPKAIAWRNELRQAFRRADDLLDFLEINPADLPQLADPGFPVLVPRPYAKRINKGDCHDPLLRQVFPDQDEAQVKPGFMADPVGDQASRVQRGLLHKYQGRLLLITTGACAIHCRYCFRQAYPYAQDHFSQAQTAPLIDYIDQHPDVEEIILSGGDPLMLDTARLRALTDALADRPQINRFRIHTRLPLALPSRIDSDLVNWIQSLPWQVVVVIHANHAREYDQEVDQAIAALHAVNATVFNQTVLLKGVNDQAEILADLMRRGFEAGVIPYYLHLLDRVSGAARFEQNEKHALALVEQLRLKLSGYLVPRLVREQAGAPYKLPVL